MHIIIIFIIIIIILRLVNAIRKEPLYRKEQCWTVPSSQNDLVLCGIFDYFHWPDALPGVNSW